MNKQKGNVKNKLAEHGVFIAKKGILFQLVTALIITLLAGIIAGQHSAISTAAGAVISILPTAIFSGFAFKYAGASKNELVAQSFSQGSKMKLALTIILFVIAFRFLHVVPLVLFMAFVITTVSHALAMFHYVSKE